MSKRFLAVIATLCLSAVVWAAAETKVDPSGSAFPQWYKSGLYVGPTSPNPTNDKLNKVTRFLAASATIDFTSLAVGVQDSSAITVTGAQTSDSCTVGTSTTVGALAADFMCYVSAAGQVKVRFMPRSLQEGVSGVLNGGSPSTVVVAGITAGSRCTASVVGTAAGTAVMVSLTTTNLTLTGVNAATNVVNYNCAAPVDPASDTYRVYVRSNQ